jgi:hypothetical protein
VSDVQLARDRPTSQKVLLIGWSAALPERHAYPLPGNPAFVEWFAKICSAEDKRTPSRRKSMRSRFGTDNIRWVTFVTPGFGKTVKEDGAFKIIAIRLGDTGL